MSTVSLKTKATSEEKSRNRKILWREIRKHWQLYLFVLPCVVSVLVFCYIPMPGILIAFKDYSFKKGILGSDWAGLKHIMSFVSSPEFWMTVKNTLAVTILNLVIGFPAPILLALLLNEIKSAKFKRVVQTFSYLPHFISWVVVVQLMNVIFTPYGGIFNEIRKLLGMESIFVMGQKSLFYPLVVCSDMWKGIGWGSIIYLSAIAGVYESLYEAADIDGANRLQKAWHITLPAISGTVILLLIMRMSGLLSAGYDQILLLQQPSNLVVSQVLDTYVIQTGLEYGKFELATAVGLVGSIFSLIMVCAVNAISRRVSETSLW